MLKHNKAESEESLTPEFPKVAISRETSRGHSDFINIQDENEEIDDDIGNDNSFQPLPSG